MIEGGCLCGGIRYQYDGEIEEIVPQAETDALIKQIEGMMTAEQMQAIEAMNLTPQDTFALMQEMGLGRGGGSCPGGDNAPQDGDGPPCDGGGGFPVDGPPDGGGGGGSADRFLPPDHGERSEGLRGGSGSTVLAIPGASGRGGG